MEDIEGNIGQVVQEYLEENDIQIDLTGYATETYVDEAVAAIELTPGPAGPKGEDGAPGKDGEPGPKGEDGYTPVKGVDYFDGKDGLDGKDGKDGAPGKDGKDGEPGPKGDTGEKGADGAPGKSGVYVGTEEPEDEEIVVWIDTAGESDELEAAEGGSY